MTIPGSILAEVKHIATTNDRSGRGRVVGCPRCRKLCEVIEHVTR